MAKVTCRLKATEKLSTDWIKWHLCQYQPALCFLGHNLWKPRFTLVLNFPWSAFAVLCQTSPRTFWQCDCVSSFDFRATSRSVDAKNFNSKAPLRRSTWKCYDNCELAIDTVADWGCGEPGGRVTAELSPRIARFTQRSSYRPQGSVSQDPPGQLRPCTYHFDVML